MMDRRKSLAEALRRALVLALLLLSALTVALAERRERLIDSWRPVHYDVSLTFNDQLTELTRAETKISVLVLKGPLKVIDLDFGQMTVNRVEIKNRPVRFEQRDGKLNVQLAEPASTNQALTIFISYHGRPADGLILMKDKAGKPSATGDNWPDRVHHWIPCLDHPSAKATVNFMVTAPARETVVANGRWMATRNDPDKQTRTWSYTESRPIPAYCMVVAVGEYAHLQPPVPTVTPLDYYVPQTDRAQAVQGFSAAPPALQFFSETIAPYPYEKLALIVGATRFGGMENSSAIVFSGGLFNTPVVDQPLSRRFNIRRGLVELMGHEVAHQWFGDAVSIKTWSDLWLSEGFATYFAGLFVERYEGKEAFRDYMRRAAEKYFSYARGRRAPIHDTETVDLFKLLNANNYQKGAWVLHMLRGLMGDEAFFKGIRAYYGAHEHKTASTEDLRAALEKASGLKLKEFFARWVYSSGHPRYEASWKWQRLRGERGMLILQLKQTQEDEQGAPFLIPLTAEIVTAEGAQRATLRPTGRETIIRLPLSSRPVQVRIDPDEMVLKEMVVRQAN
jgi:aminopeptidase N